MKRTLIIIVVIVLAVGLIAPGLIGVLAQNRHEDQLASAMQASPYIELEPGDFDRGWFSSRGRYRVQLVDGAVSAPEPGEPAAEFPVLVIDSRLHHGPFALATAFKPGGTLLPVLGTVESKVTVASGNGETRFELPGSVITNVHLDGSGDLRYASGPVEFEEGGERVSWGGADIGASFDSGGTHIEAEGTIESLSAVADDGRFELGAVTFAGHQTLTDYGFHIGESRVQVPRVSFASATDGRMALTELRAHSAVGMPDEFAVVTVEMSLEELHADEWRGGPAVIRLQFDHLDPEALGRLAQFMQNVNAQAEPDAQQAADVMNRGSEHVTALLASGAGFALEEFRVQTPEGEMFARMRLRFPETGTAGAGTAFALLGGLDGDLNLVVPQSLVHAANAANAEAQQYLQMLLESGFIRAEDGNYVLEAEYRGGLLTVNGLPFPLPFGAPPPQAGE